MWGGVVFVFWFLYLFMVYLVFGVEALSSLVLGWLVNVLFFSLSAFIVVRKRRSG